MPKGIGYGGKSKRSLFPSLKPKKKRAVKAKAKTRVKLDKKQVLSAVKKAKLKPKKRTSSSLDAFLNEIKKGSGSRFGRGKED